MKNATVIFLFALLSFGCQSNKNDSSGGTNRDKPYTLTIVDKNIKYIRDTVYWGKKHSFVNVQIKLINQSSEILSYTTMTCSSDINFDINNKLLEVGNVPCQMNVPVINAIGPHKTILFNLIIIFRNIPKKGNYLYHINMDLDFDFKENLANGVTSKQANKIHRVIRSDQGAININ